MNPQIELASTDVADFVLAEGSRVVPAAPMAFQPAMVPPETPSIMRRQPTPILIGPLRWSVWAIIVQPFSNILRQYRYTLGYERD